MTGRSINIRPGRQPYFNHFSRKQIMTMNFKNLVFSLVALLMVSISTVSAESDPIKTNSWQSQMVDYLDRIDLSQQEDVTSVMIDFMIIEGGQIVVISTNQPEIEDTIKERLNYKVLEDVTFEPYRKYTLPVSFKK